ncbi:MAG: glycosyltransferase family 4 protein [Flavobacteriaceae bacterium]|nr:glycosyltransferase family 4 protein [Flavobacteriaceae bacterium]
MKVLHITNNFPTKQYPVFGIFVKEQIDSLSNLGVSNEVYFINGREFGLKAYWSSIKKLRKKLKSSDYNILHCHHSFSALILFLTFRFFKFKKIVSYQNPPEKEGGFFLLKLVNFFFNVIIVKNMSETNNTKVKYLPNGVNTDFFKSQDVKKSLRELKLDANKKYILFMDSYKRRTQKRVDRFDEVINILQKNGNPYNIEPLVLTNTDRSLIPSYMSVSSLHLLTSDFEGSPNSVKECLACNTPIVSCPVGNVDDLIGDVAGCYVSESFEPEELARLVLKCLEKESFNGRDKLLSKKLDINSVALNLEAIYKSMI